MAVSREQVLDALRALTLPDGSDIVTRDLVRALSISGESVRFVIEAESAEMARAMEPVRAAAEALVRKLPGVEAVSVVLTAHTPQSGQAPPPAPGLLDADIYGPSQPRMMGVNKRPASPDGKTIIPLKAHGVTMMSLGLMLEEDKPVVWRGPMLMGALQQMLGQVEWGGLDVLVVDLPPGTGDVQLTLCQRAQVTGAIVVSTPQDVALLDARKAIGMFQMLKPPVLGLIENMSTYICPNCQVS